MRDWETNRVRAEAIESVDGMTRQEFVLDQVRERAKVSRQRGTRHHNQALTCFSPSLTGPLT